MLQVRQTLGSVRMRRGPATAWPGLGVPPSTCATAATEGGSGEKQHQREVEIAWGIMG